MSGTFNKTRLDGFWVVIVGLGGPLDAKLYTYVERKLGFLF